MQQTWNLHGDLEQNACSGCSHHDYDGSLPQFGLEVSGKGPIPCEAMDHSKHPSQNDPTHDYCDNSLPRSEVVKPVMHRCAEICPQSNSHPRQFSEHQGTPSARPQHESLTFFLIDWGQTSKGSTGLFHQMNTLKNVRPSVVTSNSVTARPWVTGEPLPVA